jgi:hypothetical protein
MATMVMTNSGCEIEQEVPAVEEYGDEVLCAGWNPQLSLTGESPVAELNKHVNLLAELATTDIDAFLKKMYEYQS